MTPKEKAIELVGKYKPILPHYNSNDNLNKAKQCARIVIDEVESFLIKYGKETDELQNMDRDLAYLDEVKNEINNL